MCETVVGAVIGVTGTLLGVGISFLIEIWRSRKEKERVTLELKINTYADAIRYISLYAKLTMYQNMHNQPSDGTVKDLLAEEGELFNRFHPIFTIIAPREKVNAFNDLRNEISSNRISQEEAYKSIVKFLDFNIND